MDRKNTQVLILFITILSISVAHSEYYVDHQETLKKIIEKARQNEELAGEIGYQQITVTKKIKDGKISNESARVYRTVWLQNQPYMELIKVDGKELNSKEKKQEAERKAKFLKSLREKKKDDEDMTWEEVFGKYDFQQLPADSIGHYVFSFKPKPGKLRERSRSEKVLNHVKGTFWADEEFHIVRAEAALMDNVRFGLGILGNLEKLELRFEQQDFQSIRVPSTFYVNFKAKVALFKTEERQIQATYKDFFRRQK